MKDNVSADYKEKNFPSQNSKDGRPNYQRRDDRNFNNDSMKKNQQFGSNIKNKEIQKIVEEIKGKKLSEYLTVDDINLPDGVAYKIASINNLMNTNQLRKFFDMIKQAENHINSIEKCQEELIRILPHIAYSVGRKNCSSDFFYLMKACISKQTLATEKDIRVLIDFITAIVAYHKFLNK